MLWGNIYNGVAKTLRDVETNDDSFPSINEGEGMSKLIESLESNKKETYGLGIDKFYETIKGPVIF